MSANNINNPQRPQGSAPSSFGMASASVPGNQGFPQSQMTANFPAQFQAQAMVHAQSKAQAQFQAQMQAGMMTMNQTQGIVVLVHLHHL